MYRIIIKLTAMLMLLVAGVATAGPGIWQDASSLQAQAKTAGEKIHYYSADHTALQIALSLAPHESSRDLSHHIELPMPDGSLELFAILESPIMEPALAAQYPELKSFKVYGIDDPTASGRADITPRGFHAMLLTARGRLLIDPDSATGLYHSRYRSGQPTQEFTCGVHRIASELVDQPELLKKLANRLEGNLLTYRLAVAATEEYVAAVDGVTLDPVVDAQNAIFTAIDRVNVIYEIDLGIRLILVANDGRLIENGTNVSFSNNNTFALLQENQDWIDSQAINTGFDYDIGHVFSTGGGGAAFLGAACNDPIKAKGVSGQGTPLGDPFYIDYVAHEIGHQLNAEHSFNGTTNACGDGRNNATAFEPGSGSTIMAYAGSTLCGAESLQENSDATFHAGSIAQIDSFTKGTGNCAVPVATVPANGDPTIPPIPNRVIPANTPFVLDIDSNPTDPDMDGLEYQWDQMDAGCPTNSTSFGTDNGSNALFRSYVPRSETWRNFPALGTQAQGLYDKAEVLPCQNRNLDFRLTARDGNSGQGTEDVRISVNKSAGPFKITNLNPAITIFAGTAFAVIWDRADTHLPPINCAKVDFDLISFSAGYASYTILPLAAADDTNDGSESVTLDPGIANPRFTPHMRSRVRIKCSDNIFYDISDTDLGVEWDGVSADNSIDDTEFATYFPENMLITSSLSPVCGPVVDCTVTTASTSGGKSGGSGAFDYLWLMMMTGLIALVRLFRSYGLQ